MVFSRFLSTTIFIPVDNTRHSQKPGQNPVAVRLIIRKVTKYWLWQDHCFIKQDHCFIKLYCTKWEVSSCCLKINLISNAEIYSMIFFKNYEYLDATMLDAYSLMLWSRLWSRLWSCVDAIHIGEEIFGINILYEFFVFRGRYKCKLFVSLSESFQFNCFAFLTLKYLWALIFFTVESGPRHTMTSL
jgi:hypothetical protein